MEYLTKEGLKQLKAELTELKTTRLWEIAQWLREAATQGDLTENAEYLEAKEAQTALEEKIDDLERTLRNATVVTKRVKGVASVGAAIELATPSKKINLRLVGSEETDVSRGRISTQSPLGKALLGKKVGETVEVPTPKGIRRYKLTKIV